MLTAVLTVVVQPLVEIYDKRRKLLHIWHEVKSAVKVGTLR
jgi:hypothetical protein